MTESHHDMGRIASLKADAVGEPGSRRFYILATSDQGGTATLWMEKEQLFNLAVAIKRIIVVVEQQEISGEHKAETSPEEMESHELITSPLEVEVARLALGYDEESGLYVIDGFDSEESDAWADVSLIATEEQIDALADEAFTVCAAGRPRCFLCGAPLEPEPHECPRYNGHVRSLS